jgi:hypothetical protein
MFFVPQLFLKILLFIFLIYFSIKIYSMLMDTYNVSLNIKNTKDMASTIVVWEVSMWQIVCLI